MTNDRHVELHIKGLVQGVSYRKYCQAKAIELRLRGLVKNIEDGSVYAEAEGDIENIIVFIDWCKTGPPMAHVTDVKAIMGEPRGYTNFIIET